MSRSPRRHFLVRLLVLLGVLSLVAASCGDDSGGDENGDNENGGTAAVDSEGTTTTTTVAPTVAPPPETGEELALEVNIVEFGADGYVEIINRGAESVTLAGIHICQWPNYQDLGDIADVATLDPGATLQIPADQWGGLDAATGEAGLYSSADFGSPDGMLSYVQWGAADHQRASVAVEADLWPAVDVFVTPDPAFNSIESGGFAAEAEGWS